MAILMPELTVEVYNADYRVLSRIPWQEAVRLILRVRCTSSMCTGPPCTYTARRWRSSCRCRWRCASTYTSRTSRTTGSPAPGCCIATGTSASTAAGTADTVDHVLPRSRGGGDTWFNLVAACQHCNGLKGDRTPQRGRDDHDPRALRAEGPRPVPVRPGARAGVSRGCERAGLQRIPGTGWLAVPSARTGGLIPRSVNR